ncbi:inositol monophosphatase [Thermodesulfobacterium geofontis OPF15]|jgi:myo-inositol-1(or 4)-monophosphatase|uniref:inositol-phosphate phosphatase n=1 Tax=Thermodesulfobacterium geofontis (strain OPF15) TaxID=795359 RepID=F8C4Q8_THEGP|nr:inositol monophosphatase family protein [Thermodesulfobacterium geofontis]AEH22730.1 inositol monophosphatase [Thermodesulfobacterium geofontis OPF15]
MEIHKLFEKVKELVKSAGSVLKEMYDSTYEIYHKGKIDLVTTADIKSEEVLKKGLKELTPDIPVIGEESFSEKEKFKSSYCWMVDPLDGTTNFAHNLPWFAISVALLKEKEPILGIIYNPIIDEFFYAIKGEGAYLNEKPIKVSTKEKLIDSLLCTGFPVSKILDSPDLFIPLFEEFMKRCQGVRRFGSAALDLAYVACGRYEGFWEPYLKPWDTSAGVLLVKEAGGEVTDYFGNPYHPFLNTIVASNGKIHQQMIELTSKYHPEYYKPRKNPLPTVDIIIEVEDKIVLIYRKNYPFGWAIPGGFVDYGETLESAAIREAKEETNLDIELLYLLGCYSDPKRDPRFHTITTVFVAKGKGELKAKDDAKLAKLFKIEEIPWDDLAFDHAKILKDYLKRKKYGI